MALTIVEGWLYAEGLRSHFALRREDVQDLRTGSDGRGRLTLTDGSEVRLLGLNDASRIHLERWWHARVFGEGTPTFPPVRVHARETSYWEGVLAFSFFLSGMGSFIHIPGWLGFALRQGAWIGGLVLGIVAARRWWRLTKINVLEETRERREAEEIAALGGPASEPLQAPQAKQDLRLP